MALFPLPMGKYNTFEENDLLFFVLFSFSFKYTLLGSEYMFLSLLSIVKDMLLFTGSYSNGVFPEPLKSEEEEIMITRMLNGDKEARNTLIEHNLRLVAHIVKKFDYKNVDQDD